MGGARGREGGECWEVTLACTSSTARPSMSWMHRILATMSHAALPWGFPDYVVGSRTLKQTCSPPQFCFSLRTGGSAKPAKLRVATCP